MNERWNFVAIFYCQNTPGSDENTRQSIEQRYGKYIRLYPMPCSGRVEPVHLMRALESFADNAYLIACPEGTCRYFEGNQRAKKRIKRTRWFLESIGLEPERVAIIVREKEDKKNFEQLVDDIMKEAQKLGPSPVFKYQARS